MPAEYTSVRNFEGTFTTNGHLLVLFICPSSTSVVGGFRPIPHFCPSIDYEQSKMTDGPEPRRRARTEGCAEHVLMLFIIMSWYIA